ncbi:MAG TPA: hypothetical protein V6D20_24375 [Candidatus Obscuribacterales bacterium]
MSHTISASNVSTQSNFTVVELTPGVYVRTSIPAANHAALRAGFAGYTVNPRWTVTKLRAWKKGRQWRDALARQEMVVRPSDSMLVFATQPGADPSQSSDTDKPVQPSSGNWFTRKRMAIASPFA